METISDIYSAIKFCDDQIKEYANKQSRILGLGSKMSESEEYKKENKNRLYWIGKKYELEKLMEQKVISIQGVKNDKDDKD